MQFPNLAKMSRPPARKRKGKKDEGGGEAAATARDTKDKVYVVEVIGERKEEHGDEWMGLVGEEGFGRITWRGGPTRLLLLDENYANKRVDDLPEAVKVVLDHETNKDGSSSYELVQCQLTLFYNYWPMNEVFCHLFTVDGLSIIFFQFSSSLVIIFVQVFAVFCASAFF